MSRKRKVWVAVSLAVALVLLIPLGLRWKAQWQLNAYRKKLIAAGEKLTVEELEPKRNLQATNGALILKLVSKIQPFWQYEPSVMLSIKPGAARVSWRQPRLMETVDSSKPPTNIWPALGDALKTNEETLDTLRTLVDAGGIEFIQDYSRANLNGYTYLAQVRQSVSALRTKAVLALHQGQTQEALSYLTSCCAASKLIAKNPLMIDQLVTDTCMTIAAGGCWEALQYSSWSDGELAQLQRQWDQSDILTAAGASLAMERARAPMLFQAARASRQGLEDMLGGDSGLKSNAEIWNDFLLHASSLPSELLNAYPRYWGWKWIWSYHDEQLYLEFMQTLIEATRQAQSRHSIIALLDDRAEFSAVAPLMIQEFGGSASMTAGTQRFVSFALRAQTVANMVTTVIALERFRLVHHALPPALATLVPELLPAVPVDCMDGQDLRYRLKPDGAYLLYSVGRDGVDDGGDPTPEKDKVMSFLSGRDWVWPRAATEEEVQVYEAAQNKPKDGTKRQ